MINSILTFLGGIAAAVIIIGVLAFALIVVGTIYLRLKQLSLRLDADPFRNPVKSGKLLD